MNKEHIMKRLYGWFLLKYKCRLEKMIDPKNYDAELSRKLDCLEYLLESLK